MTEKFNRRYSWPDLRRLSSVRRDTAVRNKEHRLWGGSRLGTHRVPTGSTRNLDAKYKYYFISALAYGRHKDVSADVRKDYEGVANTLLCREDVFSSTWLPLATRYATAHTKLAKNPLRRSW